MVEIKRRVRQRSLEKFELDTERYEIVLEIIIYSKKKKH